MTMTINNDMKVYNQLAQTSYLEAIQDRLDVFNASSRGAIVLRSDAIVGDRSKEAFYEIDGEIEFRDVNSEAEVTSKKIGANESSTVKAPWKFGPYTASEESFKRRGRPVEEFYRIIGQKAAQASISGFIKYAFTSLESAIGGNTAMVVNGTFAADGKKLLTKGFRTFGDQYEKISILAMDSQNYLDLVDQAITDKIYEEAGVVIYGGQPGTLNKAVLVSDKIQSGKIFGLLPGAVEIIESQAPGFFSYPDYAHENVGLAYRAEGAFNLKLLGYSWKDEAPSNPTLSQIGTAANWRKHATSNKMTAGVMINTAGA